MIAPGAGAVIGLLGGGQLGRMFTMAAHGMGYQVWVIDPDPESPAGRIADRHFRVDYLNPEMLREVAEHCSVVTTEFENVPAEALAALALNTPVRPSPSAVRIVQDRIAEKTFLQAHGIPTTRFAEVTQPEDFPTAWQRVGGPAILKTSRLGYDGKGQENVDSLEQLSIAFAKLGRVPCVLERRLDLELEISVILARTESGLTAAYPPGENRHANGILDTTVVPARIPEQLALQAIHWTTSIAHELHYVGVIGVEFFVADGGRLYANEIAPRPHNSGHYTLDAALTSQFEQQVRAICGLPLGSSALHSAAAMANLLGELWSEGSPRWDEALHDPNVKLHLYGKVEPRPGRKMGHLNALAHSPDIALDRVRSARLSLGQQLSGAR